MILKKLLIATTLLFTLVLFGCGYFVSGTWEDDPKNWGRAFGGSVPDGVSVVHSKYTRYPHWTHEHEMYFMFKATEDQLSAFIARYGLQQYDDVAGASARDRMSPPAWFLVPDRVYEVWRGVGSLSDGRLFVEKGSGMAFFYHWQ